jgi:3-oxoacyl-[acyl-carrier protein] reductase
MTTQKKPIAVVTGGYRGIGKATGVALRALGYDTVSLDLDAESDDPDQRRCNVGDLDELIAALDAIARERGPIDVLVNNAGAFCATPFLEVSPEQFDLTMNVNLRSMFFACQHVIKAMIAENRPGRIVNVASAAGRMGSPFVEYGASKAGVIGLTRGLARVVAAHDIRVNAVAPGQVETELHRKLPPDRAKANLDIIPMKRAGQPEEIAAVIAFLVSGASSFMTGAILDANGGKH